ncbi:hypothetical protein CPB86DRAFT_789834 [Serendipita vermifera]|nr:hypothetical protein CPB86DRAFT_789834 [Serendipita vermifera]
MLPENMDEVENGTSPASTDTNSEWQRLYNRNIARDSVVRDLVMRAREDAQNLQAELDGWVFTRELAAASIKRLKATLPHLEADLVDSKASFSSSRCVPETVWRIVIEICIHQEMEDYQRQTGTTVMRPTSYLLATVCRMWRKVVLDSKELSLVVPIDPSYFYSLERHECLNLRIKRAFENTKRRPMFLCNLLQSNTYTFGNGKYVRNRNIHSLITFDTLKSVGTAKYDLHLVSDQDSINYSGYSAWPLPLLRPTNLKLTIRGADVGGSNIKSILGNYQDVEHLEVADAGNHASYIPLLFTTMPKLKSLSLRFQNFPSFTVNLVNILGANLTELKLLHNSAVSIARLAGVVRLEKLQSLSLTFPSLDFFDSLDLPALTDLHFHGPNNYEFGGMMTLGTNMLKTMQHIVRLTFHDWKWYAKSKGEKKPWCASAALQRLISQPIPTLQTVEFIRSFVTGGPLVELFETRIGDGNKPLLSNFHTLTLNHCPSELPIPAKANPQGNEYSMGITRAECETLATLVPKLNIYV